MSSTLSSPDIYSYLKSLSAAFELRNRDIAKRISEVAEFSSGSNSEFYHEAEILLKELVNAEGVSDLERKKMQTIIHAIDEAFRRIGGA